VAPLAGILRDPRAPCAKKVITPLLFDSGRGETLQPKDNVIVDPEHVAAVAAALQDARAAGRSPKAILLDAGASTYNGQDEGWPGTRWLVERYRDLGCVAVQLPRVTFYLPPLFEITSPDTPDTHPSLALQSELYRHLRLGIHTAPGL
jgi:hypothetical protein